MYIRTLLPRSCMHAHLIVVVLSAVPHAPAECQRHHVLQCTCPHICVLARSHHTHREGRAHHVLIYRERHMTHGTDPCTCTNMQQDTDPCTNMHEGTRETEGEAAAQRQKRRHSHNIEQLLNTVPDKLSLSLSLSLSPPGSHGKSGALGMRQNMFCDKCFPVALGLTP
jgi:hypothetical protein